MRRKYIIPSDSPAVCCARCWWHAPIIDKDGFSYCIIHREKRYYKCMVCSEYEIDPERYTVGNGG